MDIQNNKQLLLLLLQDLCGRLLYKVKIQHVSEPDTQYELYSLNLNSLEILFWNYKGKNLRIGDCGKLIRFGNIRYKPYLRPMSSMTKEEIKEYRKTQNKIAIQWDEYSQPIGYTYVDTYKTFDWLNRKMFDYRGLIEKGLAIEAPKGMYESID